MFKKLDFEIPETRYEIGIVKDEYEGLSIEIESETGKLFTFFIEDRILMRTMNESLIFKGIFSNCTSNWPVYQATESEFLDFFYEHGGHTYDGLGYHHIRFLGQEEIIDIITQDTPILKTK